MTGGRRALGYRLLGQSFDYLLHLRPAEWPIVTVHFLTGTALAAGLPQLLHDAGSHLLLGTVAFVVGVNGGTLALNSAFDRDEGDVAYLRNPPKPPPGLAVFGLVLMLAALVAAHWLPYRFLQASMLCVAMSILYSVPPIRLKAVAGFDWVINMAGFGFLTPYAGWALSHRELDAAGAVVLGAFALLFGALYPLTQLYQLEEDQRRGDRTLAVALGLDRSLAISLGTAVLAFAGFGCAALVLPPRGAPASGAGLLLLVASALAWGAVLLPWWRRRAVMTSADHQRSLYLALGAWAVTDVAVLTALAA